jgi:hypothetical protein
VKKKVCDLLLHSYLYTILFILEIILRGSFVYTILLPLVSEQLIKSCLNALVVIFSSVIHLESRVVSFGDLIIRHWQSRRLCA